MLYTVEVTVLFTAIGMVLTVCAAYPLSRKKLKGRNAIALLILFTLYFSAGLIPEYLLYKSLNLTNKMWVLILPLSFSPYNMLIMKSFLQTTIPDSLEESAALDGCSDMGVLLRIVLPLSTAAIATLSLFYAVTRWNSFADVRFYINSTERYTLQMKLYQVVFNSTDTQVNMLEGGRNAVLSETIKAAAIVFATVPIIIVYPFLQKHFVQGVMIGAVKE
jgi:putative aldouronate transport system permease protein